MELHYFILSIFMLMLVLDSRGQLSQESQTRETECKGTVLRASCPQNCVIAAKDILFGTAKCPLNSNATGCCDYDPTDCFMHYTDTTLQAACSGRMLCTEVKIGEEDSSSCGAPYPNLNHYLTMDYYCIPKSRIGKMCASVSLTTTGTPLYTWNNDYPSGLIRAASTSCSCSIEASSCNSKINVYFVHFELGDGGGRCSDNQSIEINDTGSIQTYTCSQNNNYKIVTKMTSVSNYITVALDNAAGIRDGKFWIGFEATDDTAQLQIDCPVKAQVNCKDCSSLDDPTDGTVTVPSTNYQSVATFSCNTGYTLVGSATRECQIDGTWSNKNPMCAINECSNLTDLQHGTVSTSNGTNYQSVATYRCDTGYTLSDNATQTCQANKTWSNSRPKCKINPTQSTTDATVVPVPQRSDIDCRPDSISVYIPQSLLSGGQNVTWRDENCSVTFNVTHYTDTVKLTACGTTVGIDDHTITFSNDLIVHKTDDKLSQLQNRDITFGEGFETVIPVKCVYARENNLTSSYAPIKQHVRFVERRHGQLDLSLEQYQTAQYKTLVPSTGNPRKVPLNGDIYLRVGLDFAVKDLRVKVDQCIATSTPSPSDINWHQLIKSGCPIKPVCLLSSPVSQDVKFSFKAFDFRHNSSGFVYIHCEVTVCRIADPNCMMGCANRTKRAASVNPFGGSHLLSTGPFVMAGDNVKEGGVSSALVFAGACLSLAVIAVGVAILGWTRKSRLPQKVDGL